MANLQLLHQDMRSIQGELSAQRTGIDRLSPEFMRKGYRFGTVNPLKHDGWDQWVLSMAGNSSIFHSAAWARVLAETYGYTPCYVTLRNGRQQAAWPLFQARSLWRGRKGVSLPFSDHCEPVSSDQALLGPLFQGVIDTARRLQWKTVEFRGANRLLNSHPPTTTYNLHVLELYSEEAQMTRRLRSSTRRNIKKALKNDIEISISRSAESVKHFYSLNCLTRKHHGLPPQPFAFFKNIHKYIINQDKGIVVLAHRDGQLMAGAVYFHFGNTATYKFGASDRRFLDQRPNNLVMWEAIKWYGRKGFRYFDLGRSEPDNQGLNQFKNGWGAEISQVSYFRYATAQQTFMPPETPLSPMINQAFRMMPIPVLRLVGSLAYRHMA